MLVERSVVNTSHWHSTEKYLVACNVALLCALPTFIHIPTLNPVSLGNHENIPRELWKD